MHIVLEHKQIEQKIMRLAHQILENSYQEPKIYLAGICGNGILLAKKIEAILREHTSQEIHLFEIVLDKESPWKQSIELSINKQELENAYIVMIDDVFNSGKTMQYAIIELLGQAVKAIKTIALVDRQHRVYPIKCNYCGILLSTDRSQRVEVQLQTSPYQAYIV